MSARARRIEGLKRAWADPEARARRIEGMKRAWADPEARARRIEGVKRAWADPEARARRIEGVKRVRAGAGAGVQCPRWVPADLVSEFFEYAARAGEQEAAAHIRRLKREMRA